MSDNADVCVVQIMEGASATSASDVDPNNTVPIVTVAKKRKVCPGKKNAGKQPRKQRRSGGKSCASIRLKAVPAPTTTGAACNCRYKCFTEVNDDMKARILVNFNMLGNKLAQDVYLGTMITVKTVVRTRPRTGDGNPRAVSNCYKVRVGKDVKRVCKLAFAALHGITRKRVETIAKQLSNGRAITPDRRGKHTKRPNKTPMQITQLVHEQISSFPMRVSNCKLKDNDSKRRYLPAQLTVKEMHQLYLKKHPESAISYDSYYKYFKSNFDVRFGSPRSDSCPTCDDIADELGSPDTSDERREELEMIKIHHQTDADAFYADIENKTALALCNQDTEVLCFDYQQNMPLPKVPPGDSFYKRQFWVYNFAISSGKMQKHHFYVYDETVGRKTCNEVISCLHNYINNVLSPDIKILYLFSDNCVFQNKNHTLTQYLFSLVRSGRLFKIVHSFPEPGHSYMPCDQAFGLIEKNLRKIDRVFLPTEYGNCIRRTSKNYLVTEVNQTMIYNFVDLLKPFFFKTLYLASCSNSLKKYYITKYKVFIYESEHIEQGVVQVSKRIGLPVIQEVKVTDAWKATCVVALNNILQPAYKTSLPLKAGKYKDVMDLAKKYVASDDMWFYNQLKSDEGSPDDPEESEGEFDG